MFSSGFLHDVRVAFRGLLKTSVLSFVVVLTMAVAIGANTAIFSVVQSVLLQPLPYPAEDRIVSVAANSDGSMAAFSPAGYALFADSNRSFEAFGGYLPPFPSPLTGDGAARQVNVGMMTSSAFDALGVFPEQGRLPTPQEDALGGPRVALLSHDLWASHYGSDPSIVGRTIALGGEPTEVVGIMPPDYGFPSPETDVWIPFQAAAQSTVFGAHFILAVARLAPSATIDAAVSDSQTLIARFDEIGYGQSWFETTFDGGASVRPLRDSIVGDSRQPLLIILGCAGFVLLIACSNVANLLLVRAEGRQLENAVRMGLGASRARLARLPLIESAILALLGGAAGVLVTYVGTRALVSIGPPGLPRLDEIGISSGTLAFAGVVSVLAGLLLGVLPAMRASSARTIGALVGGSRGMTFGHHQHRWRNVLVATQVALGLVLVIGAGLMARSFETLRSVDPGFSAEGVLTFRVSPLSTKYPEPDDVAQLYDALTERLESIPGVIGVGAVDNVPLAGFGPNFGSVIEEFPPAEDTLAPVFATRRAAPGYFETMGIPLLEGRTFTPDDHDQRLPSVIISETVKERYWPNESALGKRITVIERIPAQVVGVVGDVRDLNLETPGEQFLYLPIVDSLGDGARAMTVTVRASVEPLSLINAIRTAIAGLDPDLPMADVQTMEQILGDSMNRTTFVMSLLLTGALVAVFLGAVGIYGALSYLVSQRAPEIGIRSALGADRHHVRRIFLWHGMRVAIVGVLIGLVAAVGLGRVMQTLLYEVSPVDFVTLAVAPFIFIAVAALASYLPALRAARAAPVDALRVG